MRIFLSALENNAKTTLDRCIKENITIPFGLVSFYYISKNRDGLENFKKTLQVCDYVLVDSGAHTFQKGTKVSWEEYSKQYAEFIKTYDCDKILGYFEMDVDIQIGYKKVLELRKILNEATDKIIPVWHKNRGIDEFKRMCKETPGKIVAVTGFRNEDITDNQYAGFVKYAWKCGKKIHCLGMTRQKVLNKVPFDFTDSSSWKLSATYGTLKVWSNKDHKLKTIDTKGKYATDQLFFSNLMNYIKMVRYYNIKWSRINKDLYFKFGVRNFLLKLKLERKFNKYEKSKKIKKYNSNWCSSSIIRCINIFSRSFFVWSNPI